MKIKVSHYKKRFGMLFKQPFFWVLTLTGNIIVFLSSVFLYKFEVGSDVGPKDFLDCVLWSMGTVTTVGYGSYSAHTTVGKCLIIFLMAFGTLFVWSYMGFLVTGLIAPELSILEKDVHGMEKEMHNLKLDASKAEASSSKAGDN